MDTFLHSIAHKLSWFTVVGILAAAVYVFASILLQKLFLLDTQWATSAAVLISAVVSYVGHFHLTFQLKGRHQIHGMRFLIQLGITLALNTLAIRAATEFFEAPLWLATSSFAVLMPIVNFVVYQVYTFNHHRL